jgi:hypothetical protein
MNTGKLGDIIDVYQHVRARHAHRHQRHEGLATCDNFAFLVTRVCQQAADFVDG